MIVYQCNSCWKYIVAGSIVCHFCKSKSLVVVDFFAEFLNKLDELKDILDGPKT